VIFAFPLDDPYYTTKFGTDGEVRTPEGSGWQLMNNLPELGNPTAVQQEAPQT
jgi:hypothetical protein